MAMPKGIWDTMDPRNARTWTNARAEQGRPSNVPVEQIIDFGFNKASVEQKQATSDLLDLIAFLETGKKNVRQGDLPGLTEREKRYWKGPGEGYYQFERGPHGGGYTRANKGYSNLPKTLTPLWMHEQMVVARENDNTWIMDIYNKQQQNFVMTSYLMSDNNSKRVINNIANETNSAARRELIIDYWIDYHWAGSKGDSSKRQDKKNKAYIEINKKYQYDPNWLQFDNNLNYEFNMDNY